jgi:hypothetical protein
LSAAFTNPGADRVEIGPGTFDENSGGGDFAYFSSVGLDIVGSGVGQTFLKDSSPGAFEAVLQLGSNPSIHVSDLTIQMATDNERGLTLTGAAASDISIEQTGNPANLAAAIVNDGSLTDSSITMTPGPTNSNIGINAQGSPTGTTTLQDDSITGPDVGIFSSATSPLRRLTVSAQSIGLFLTRRTADVQSSLIRTTASGSRALQVDDAGNNIAEAIEVNVRNATLSGPGTAIGVKVRSANVAGQSVSVDLADSIVNGYSVPVDCALLGAGTAMVTTEYSNYPDGSNTGTCGFTETARTNLTPGFVGAGDFHLQPSSQLIDAGTPGPLDPSESSTDLDGNPRLIDATPTCPLDPRRDLGAYEYQVAQPTCAPPTPPAEQPDIIAPETRLDKRPARRIKTSHPRVKVTFSFGSTESGSTFRCKLDTKPERACSSPKSYRVRPGRHVFHVSAIDAAGNRDPSPATARFKVISNAPG